MAWVNIGLLRKKYPHTDVTKKGWPVSTTPPIPKGVRKAAKADKNKSK